MTRLSIAAALVLVLAGGAQADEPSFTLTIANHRFEPAELTVPANTKVKLVVRNQDDTSEEFDSKSLHREKVIAGKSEAAIYIGPLPPGRYPFEGEFHAQTAQGVIIAQ
jgi:hypothetical protein